MLHAGSASEAKPRRWIIFSPHARTTVISGENVYIKEINAIRDTELKFEDIFKETVHITAEGTLISRTNECHIHDTLKAFIPVKWSRPRISDEEAVS